MKTIEEIKVELTMKVLAGTLSSGDIVLLPRNKEIRTFVCSISPQCAYWYANYVDRARHDETWEAASVDEGLKHAYVTYVDTIIWGWGWRK